MEDADMDLSGRIAVVTGGASGMGAAVVDSLTKLGARPVAWDRNEAAEVVCDVSEPASVAAAIERTLQIAGPPTVLVASAGIGHASLLAELPAADWDRVIDVNLKGMFLTMQACFGPMRDAGGGAMVVITSINAHLADPGMGAYCVSKAGLEMLMRVAANEWAEHGIRVNAVGPGVTKTPMVQQDRPLFTEIVEQRTPLRRMGEAQEIADAVVALLELDWVTGQNLMADGGLSNHSSLDSFGSARRAGRQMTANFTDKPAPER
jgi:NAD(P)-dependent dehydrogenase (short-subunit alcohol dehydrogenase family)